MNSTEIIEALDLLWAIRRDVATTRYKEDPRLGVACEWLERAYAISMRAEANKLRVK